MNTSLVLVLIGILQVTSYQSVKSQTDATPFYTSTFKWKGHERVTPDGVAVSEDLLCTVCKKLHKPCREPGLPRLHYGEWLYIDGVGLKRVNDVMNPRFTNRLDVWVGSLKEEKMFHKKFKHTKLHVYKIEAKETTNGH